ncbi:MAG TPA: KH domain-containing protein [Firmicutes bacterium]|jgi:predicted RNA-binding protein YlqC (UPF0109 family)|nr:KH domain-containing protein [Bacillota bacterium]
MKELVEFLARALVDHPEAVQVREIEDGETVIYEVRVEPDDMGKIIGKHGRIVRALRTVVKAAAVKDGRRVLVEVVQ